MGRILLEIHPKRPQSFTRFDRNFTTKIYIEDDRTSKSLVTFHTGKSYGCFQKKGCFPQIMNLIRVFHDKPSILGVFPLFLVQHQYLFQSNSPKYLGDRYHTPLTDLLRDEPVNIPCASSESSSNGSCYGRHKRKAQ